VAAVMPERSHRRRKSGRGGKQTRQGTKKDRSKRKGSQERDDMQCGCWLVGARVYGVVQEKTKEANADAAANKSEI